MSLPSGCRAVTKQSDGKGGAVESPPPPPDKDKELP
jgi:hypothetical protein